MDFNIASTPEEEAFRDEVREFLKQEADDIDLITSSRGSYSDEGNVATRRVARKLGQRGWLSLTWPEEYGEEARQEYRLSSSSPRRPRR